jgi:hypothetical protein
VNKVEVGFFSFTEITDPTEHGAYNEWHQLDHLPEQLPLRGVACGQRWVATPECAAAALHAGGDLAGTHYVTLYLMTQPVEQTLAEFLALGQRLRSLGRFHLHRRSHLAGPFQMLEASSAARVLVSPEAVPFRPHRGVFVIVEKPDGPLDDEHAQWLHREWTATALAIEGVAGVWSFATSPRLNRLDWEPGNRRVTVCYLDGDPLDVTSGLAPVVEQRWRGGKVHPEYAAPLETITPWQWDWFDGA